MAIRFNELKTVERSVELERLIDDKIREITALEGGIRAHTWGIPATERIGYRSFDIVIPGTLNPGEKLYLLDAYTEAGWDVRKIQNSEDNGERPGLFQIQFYIKD